VLLPLRIRTVISCEETLWVWGCVQWKTACRSSWISSLASHKSQVGEDLPGVPCLYLFTPSRKRQVAVICVHQEVSGRLRPKMPLSVIWSDRQTLYFKSSGRHVSWQVKSRQVKRVARWGSGQICLSRKYLSAPSWYVCWPGMGH